MRKVIDGRIYNTETAQFVCDISPGGYSQSDFEWEDTALYQTRRGAFFIAGRGNARSRWAVRVGQNGWGSGSGVELQTEEEAKRLVERHAKPDVFVEVFGEPEEG
jgi:hypothetical protein